MPLGACYPAQRQLKLDAGLDDQRQVRGKDEAGHARIIRALHMLSMGQGR